MRYVAAILVLICVQGCASLPYEKQACQGFAAYPQLAAPPDNVEQLYALGNFGRPRKGYHEHWYKLGEDALAACRHLKGERSGCGTEETQFFRRVNGWEIGPTAVIVCGN